MARFVVVASGEHPERVPFLRGILTRSLQEAGLPFEDAYALASNLRDELSDSEEITIEELRRRVDGQLEKFGTAVLHRYRNPPAAGGSILIRDAKGDTSQFSRQRHRRVLESSGLSYEEATVITTAPFGHLLKKGLAEIEARRLGKVTYRYLRMVAGAEAARRYLVMVKLLRQDNPVLILIGGAPGTGKSALATELAQRLGIVRVQSTDLLREVMRMMIPERLLPVLHRSSYDAWRALPQSNQLSQGANDLLRNGYRAQADLLTVPCEAVIRRTLHERSSLIIEGVHVQPGLWDKLPEATDAIIVPITLAVLSRQRLQENFRGRGVLTDDRRAERYLRHFKSIWGLQSYLLSEADKSGIAIIVNNHKEQVIRDVMVTVIDRLSEKFADSADQVFA